MRVMKVAIIAEKKLIELANAGYVFCRNVAPFITCMNHQNSILLFK